MDAPDNKEKPKPIETAHQGFTGKRLTEAQFDDCWAITGIMERAIKRSGSFKDKLGDFANAFARTEKFDALKGETIIRDLFKSRYGQSMNAMRQDLQNREANLTQSEKNQAMGAALNVGTNIAEGKTMPFYRAYNQEAVKLSKSLKITEAGAKTLMKDVYRAHEGNDLYSDCKTIEQQYHLPKVEAQRQQQKATQSKTLTRSQ